MHASHRKRLIRLRTSLWGQTLSKKPQEAGKALLFLDGWLCFGYSAVKRGAYDPEN